MQRSFKILETTRNNIEKLVSNFSIEQLNYIPEGFNNNLFWNLAHIVVTQQLLCYKNSGLETYLKDEMIDEFRKGSAPSRQYTSDDLETILNLLNVLIEKLRSDYESNKFESYNTYPTSYGFELNSIESAIEFNNVHEGLHLGIMMAIRKLIP